MRRLFRLSGREPDPAADVQAELDLHLAMKVDALVAAGWNRADAEVEARRQFGSRPALERATRVEAGRVARRRRWRDWRGAWAADVTQGLRSLWRDPGYTVMASLVLALGVGSSLAVLAVADRILFRPLPFAEPDRLALLLEANSSGGLRLPSYPTVQDWQDQAPGFQAIAYVPGTQLAWRAERGTETILTAFPSPEFFDVMQVRPMLGRTLTSSDEAQAARVAVLTHAFWQRRFAGDASVLGTTLSLADGAVTVVGVMPPGFRLPAWADMYVPLAAMPPSLRSTVALRGNHADSQVFGRLAPGVSLERATAGMRVVATRLAEAYPVEQAGWTSVAILPIQDYLADPSQLSGSRSSLSTRTVLLFGGAVLLVLLVACANVACLTLVRSRARERELGIRAAIGAGRGTLVRRLLFESGIVAAIGAALGLALAMGLLGVLQRARPDLVPRLEEVRLDPRLIALTLALAVVSTLASGLVPALRSTRASLADLVKGGGARITSTAARIRAQRGLVVLQLAVAVTLVLGASVLVRSFLRVVDTPVGFDPNGLLSITVNPDRARYPTGEATVELYRALVASVQRVPGVEAAAVTNHVPLTGASMITSVIVDGRPADDPSRQPSASFRAVSPDYFDVMRVPVIRGRGFTDADLFGPNDGLVINETLARRAWPDHDPIGRRLTIFRAARWLPDFGEPISGVVIGVVGDVRHFGPEGALPNEVYLPHTWNPWPWTGLVVRVRGDPEGMIDPVWRAIASVDPDLPVESGSRPSVTTFARIRSENQAPRRMMTGVAVGVAVAALLLAVVGLYGVMAYQVGLRRREIGIRGALGASRSEILRQVMGQGLLTAGLGVAGGLVGGWLAASLLRALVFEVSARDLVSFVVVPLVLMGVAALAVYSPARRASGVDPVEVLKGE